MSPDFSTASIPTGPRRPESTLVSPVNMPGLQMATTRSMIVRECSTCSCPLLPKTLVTCSLVQQRPRSVYGPMSPMCEHTSLLAKSDCKHFAGIVPGGGDKVSSESGIFRLGGRGLSPLMKASKSAIDLFFVRRTHAMRRARINFQRCILISLIEP